VRKEILARLDRKVFKEKLVLQVLKGLKVFRVFKEFRVK
jgi:hypothetical protein